MEVVERGGARVVRWWSKVAGGGGSKPKGWPAKPWVALGQREKEERREQEREREEC